ncbi:MAG: NADP-dependent oxidoreductase [Chloroflexaceae bacterium]|jgi:hypothetical protein|nr:NADP-dependent oxidoreductase [Chloroflexaceae bacterium]
MINRQFTLAAYAEGVPTERNFTLVEAPLADPGPGQLLVQAHYFSMDPFPRLRISGDASVAPQLPLGSVMIGRGVGQVVASQHPDFPVGCHVAGELGWQEYALSDGNGLRLVDPALAPLPAYLGLLGPSGLAAYFATLRQGQPKAGETVVVSAAAGSVGSTACQIAAIAGARVVGIAGGANQLAFLQSLGATPVDYSDAKNLPQALGAASPQGIDVFVDMVGGSVHDAVMEHLNVGARIVLVGTIANYNLGPGEVDTGPRHLYRWILKRVRLSGFLVGDYAAEWPAALAELASWLRDGRLRYRETIFDGFESAPQAFASLFGGDNVGKMLVKLLRET